MNWFYDLNVAVALPLFVGLFVAASCGIVIALRRPVHRLVQDPDQWDRVLGHTIGTFGVFFGILLALVAVSVYENYADTRVATLKEAAHVAALYRGAAGLPPQTADGLEAALDRYVHVVIDEDWPLQRDGIIPETSTGRVDEFEDLLHRFEPTNGQEQANYIQMLGTFDDFVEARRERIDATTLELPGLFWAVLWVGAIVNAVLIAFIYVKSLRLHLLMAGLLALFIGLVMFVTADMDHPYAGAISVGPGAFERVLEQTIDRE
ncbi:DUF4239 domain-containing protein [Agromyces protaetiae]|uniref:bestrophin-like domain n=1 Tax=Agromyces protaetiae TaxID=2509455 RepID=UPI0013EB3854|nr:DUF4239 domain-containing protein [Agromyces protaetiae]